MNRIARIILDLAVTGWIVLVIIAIVMTISSCNNNSAHAAEYSEEFHCENCDEID